MASTAAKTGRATTVVPAAAPRLFLDGVTAALHEIGRAEVRAIEAHLSVPVERDWAGNVVKRSEPGEAPRKEEDILRQNVAYHVVKEDGSLLPTLYITASRPPQEPDDDPNAAIILEEGGVSNWGYVAPRPFMAPAAERIAKYAAEVVAEHLRKQTTK